jgi:hypothetical protein
VSPPAPEVRDWDGYAERWAAAHGGYDPRSASPLVRGWLRMSYELGAAVIKIGVRSPNAVTVLGLLLSVAVPVAVAGGRGWAFAGAVLVLLSAVADTVDGVLAVVTGRASRLGQVYDSTADRVAASGCTTPIVAGVMPVTAIGTIARSQQLSGAPFPPALAARFEQVADDPQAVRSLGIDLASEMCERLLDEGVPGIHFITLNRSTATREVWQQLGVGARV